MRHPDEFRQLLVSRMSEAVHAKSGLCFTEAGTRTVSKEEFIEAIAHYRSGLDKLMRPRSPIVIVAHRSVELIALVGACIQAAATFCILDPESPMTRQLEVAKRLNARTIVRQQDAKLRFTTLDDWEILLSEADASMLDGAMYVVFTSGSSGSPKGVVVGPENFFSFQAWYTQSVNLSNQDRFSIVNPAHFDNFIADLTLSLFSPGIGCLLSPNLGDLSKILTELKSSNISHWFSVPSTLKYLARAKLLSQESLPSLRWCSFGGEPYLSEELQRLGQLLPSQCKLVNVYGPSETTCISSMRILEKTDYAGETVYPPIGVMNDNFSSWLDPDSGELILAGAQVARGYLGGQQGGFDYRNGIWSYATGDIMREADSCELFFKSRIDRQMKILGHRIEPGEVEASSLRIPGVLEAFAGRAQLVGEDVLGLVFSGDCDELTLRQELSSRVPSYLVPRVFLKLPALPRNANGKLDERSLEGLLRNA